MAGIKGYQRGFIIESFSLLAFFVGLFVALKLAFPITAKFFGEHDAFWLIALGVFLALFFLLVWGIKHLAEAVKKVVDFTLVGILDNVLGVLLSVIKWLFILSVSIWVMHSIDMEFPKRWIKDADFYFFIASIAPVLFEVSASILPFFQDVIDSMKETPKRPGVLAMTLMVS